MKQLAAGDFFRAIPLVREHGFRGYSSHAHAVLEGKQPGVVLVDRVQDPRTAIVINYGFSALACGEPDNRPFVRLIPDILSQSPLGFPVVFWASSPAWRDCLAEVMDVEVHRTVFAFHGLPKNSSQSIEAGFRIQQIDERLADRLTATLDKETVPIWGGPEIFCREAAGFCALFDGQIVSSTTAYHIGDGHVEINIVTAKEFRRRGLARRVCEKLIDWCLMRGLTPDWSCNSENQASAALAESLGFTRSQEISGFLWGSIFVWSDGKWRPKET